MKLGELQSPFSQHKIITYAPDGNTAIKKNKRLQSISGHLYRGQDDISDYGQVSCRIYIFCEDLGIGMYVSSIGNPNERDVDEIAARMPPGFLQGPQAFIEHLDHAVDAVQRITNAEIALAGYIAPDKVPSYVAARQRARDRDDERRAEQRAEQKAEDAAYCERCNAETQSIINTALDTVRNGGRWWVIICPLLGTYTLSSPGIGAVASNMAFSSTWSLTSRLLSNLGKVSLNISLRVSSKESARKQLRKSTILSAMIP